MKSRVILGIAAGAILVSTMASAQEQEDRRRRAPNLPLAAIGSAALLSAYIPSFFVAVGSPRSDDNWLFLPGAGPWIDLATRGGCNGNCTGEATNKTLLVIDGIFQTAGTVALISSFFVPGNSVAIGSAKKHEKATIQFTPMQLGHGPSMGAGVVGSF